MAGIVKSPDGATLHYTGNAAFSASIGGNAARRSPPQGRSAKRAFDARTKQIIGNWAARALLDAVPPR